MWVELGSRVKIARAVVSKRPGLAAILRERPDRAARFYARFEVTERMFLLGVPTETVGLYEDQGNRVSRAERYVRRSRIL
jgi:hypothetical protein